MQDIKELSFEQAYDELEEVIAKLESGEMSLEEAVTLYERGRSLSTHCQELLDKAELRIQKLNEDGTLKPHEMG